MIFQDASLPRIDLDNLQKHIFNETINAVSTDPRSQPSPATRDTHTRATRSVRFRIPDRKGNPLETRADQQGSPYGDHNTGSFVSSLPSTVPETMDDNMIDGAAEIEVESEDREAHVQDTQFSNATQPISQTAYEEVIRSRSEQLLSDPVPEETRVEGAEWDEEEHGDLEHSIQEGDSNFVDICSSFIPVPDAIDSIPIDISPTQTQHEFTQFRESQRFKTPATAGKKRDYTGNFIETPVQSRNPFARNSNATPGNVVGLSQAFATTQAASSPLPVVPASELPSDKPSPGLSVERNVKGLPTSSPSKMLSDISRPSEPSARYVPVRQSQTVRQALTSEAENAQGTQESISDHFDSITSVVQRQKRARAREREARVQMEAASSPISHSKRDALQVGNPLVRAASERPASVIRSDSKSRSIPSSPPAIETEETTDEMDLTEADHDIPVNHPLQFPSEELPTPATSSAGLRDRRNVTTLVPNTTKRATRSTATLSHNIQPSPCERRTRPEVHAEPASSNPIRVANSQRSFPFTQDAGLDIAASTADSVDMIPASPEGRLQSTEPSGFPDLVVGRGSHENDPEVATEQQTREANDVGLSEAGKLEGSGIPEMSSATTMQSKQKSSTYTTALTHQNEDTNATATEWSSQPVRTGRKRRRLDEISQEDVLPAATQSSAFDPGEVLGLDPNFEGGGPVISQDPDPILTRKRTKLRSPDIVEDNAREELVSNAAPNSANIGRQLRNKNVMMETSDQDAENAAPTSSLTELPTTPSTVRTPSKKISASKSIWSPGASPQPSRIRAGGGLQAARASLQEIVPGRNGRVISKTTLKTPKSISTSLPPIQESSPDPLAISATKPTIGTPAPPTTEVVAPQMIFACFLGKTRAYYPAICQGYSEDTKQFTIVWPGYDPELLDEHAVCSIDLRIGDEIKVDRQGWPKTVWRIRDFGSVQPAGEASSSIQDIYGHTTCLLEPKNTTSDLRKGIWKNESIAIEHIYLDSNQFTRFRKRPFKYDVAEAAHPSTMIARPSTPPVRISTPSTPSSRGRKSDKDSSVQLAIRQGILSDMVFAISTSVEKDQPEIVDIIRNHGGILLRSNFQELVTEDTQLRSQFKQLSFAALLSDKHSRTEKYLQALALGLPCLSWKWVVASTKQGKLVRWEDYLLPAGESSELDGAIRSRILPQIDVASATLSEIIDKRPRFFADSNAVFVTGRGKVELQRKTYLFFIRVMGLTNIEQVIDLPGAKLHLASVEKKGPTWLVVDDKDHDAALKMTQSIKNESTGYKKRNKTNGDGEWTCRILNRESLVQSLILGRLCEIDGTD